MDSSGGGGGGGGFTWFPGRTEGGQSSLRENNCGTLLRFNEFQDPNVELILK